jgi:hypothetical protein
VGDRPAKRGQAEPEEDQERFHDKRTGRAYPKGRGAVKEEGSDP